MEEKRWPAWQASNIDVVDRRSETDWLLAVASRWGAREMPGWTEGPMSWKRLIWHKVVCVVKTSFVEAGGTGGMRGRDKSWGIYASSVIQLTVKYVS